MLLNFCKYALLSLLLPAIMEGIISSLFSLTVIFFVFSSMKMLSHLMQTEEK